MMLKELSLWSQKLNDGQALAQEFLKKYADRVPSQVKKLVFVGMGGSGIAGRIMKTLLDKKTGIETIAISSSVLPLYIDTQSLAIVVSYSGNTWETVSVLEHLVERGIPTIVLAHGGKALEIAQAKELPFAVLPESLTPRSALGNFLGFLPPLFEYFGILDGSSLVEGWKAAADKYIPLFIESSYFKDFLERENVYEFFHVWGVTGDSDGVAYRANTQFNENSKIDSVYSDYPELAHNLLVGVTGTSSNPFVVLFHTDYLSPSLESGIAGMCEILKENGVILYKPPILGDTFESQLFTMVLWADFASYYLGKERGVDIERVKVIEELKKRQK